MRITHLATVDGIIIIHARNIQNKPAVFARVYRAYSVDCVVGSLLLPYPYRQHSQMAFKSCKCATVTLLNGHTLKLKCSAFLYGCMKIILL